MRAHTSVPKVLIEPDAGPSKVVVPVKKSLTRRAREGLVFRKIGIILIIP